VTKRREVSAAAIATQTAGHLTGAGIGLAAGGPVGALLGASAVALVAEALEATRSYFVERHEARVATVIALAAKEAGETAEDLIRKLQSSPDKEDLFLRTLRAAQDAALTEKLVALAHSLKTTATTDDLPIVATETAFVRGLADVDRAHLAILRAFTQSTNELGLGNGEPDFDRVPESLNSQAFRFAFPKYADILDPLLSVLNRHGLIQPVQFMPIVAVGEGQTRPLTSWSITPFGRSFIERIDLATELLGTE
jgi:hypothetical protein